jgi:hypothetical protein
LIIIIINPINPRTNDINLNQNKIVNLFSFSIKLKNILGTRSQGVEENFKPGLFNNFILIINFVSTLNK